MGEIASIKPHGPQSQDERNYLLGARETLRKALIDSCKSVKATLRFYDNAYRRLTQLSEPTAFRDFLLEAPALFNDLGERLGGIEHIVSFWRFRFPANQQPVITAPELVGVFLDFESSLGAGQTEASGILPRPEIFDGRAGAVQAA
jgi:hypothetical protein